MSVEIFDKLGLVNGQLICEWIFANETSADVWVLGIKWSQKEGWPTLSQPAQWIRFIFCNLLSVEKLLQSQKSSEFWMLNCLTQQKQKEELIQKSLFAIIFNTCAFAIIPNKNNFQYVIDYYCSHKSKMWHFHSIYLKNKSFCQHLQRLHFALIGVD